MFIPWLDTSRVRSCRFRPLMKQFFWVFVVDCVLLGYLGAQSVDAVWNLGGITCRWSGWHVCGTAYYYGFFWVVMPVIGLIETPKPLPDSIANPCSATRRSTAE